MSTETQTRTALTAALDMAAPIVTPQALVSFGVALLDLIKAEVIQATGAVEEYLSASALAKRLGVPRWQVYEHGGDPIIRKLKCYVQTHVSHSLREESSRYFERQCFMKSFCGRVLIFWHVTHSPWLGKSVPNHLKSGA